MIFTKIQFVKTCATESDLTTGEIPYYENNGKLYLKETDEEIEIVEEEIIIL